ncbi:3'-5' exoribonuclease YhaM [Terrilactibacillus sp. BCM23-1]|uniref:3'-5' exoribonuclease YhaM n=1 Tax=Terrilactibacillus tamarindi TaxID=2599694 RepID=A0A6N8CR90_9BACI|nr:3'-5' exoribonuclease YhaM [Terrilactibacillus tamarindi]MTT30476.1 3'-5' exoribonuclease YhaM [Terrilactibacillus tamarindi]
MSGISSFNEGDKVNQFVLIKSVTKGTTSTGKPFLTLILQDRTGEIDAKLWDCSEQDIVDYAADKIVKIHGEITLYRGKKQLRLHAIRLTNEQDNIKKSSLIMSAPVSIEDMVESITKYVFEIKNPNLQRLTRALLKKHHEAFFEFPAAVRNHHEFMSGLAYHVVSMLKLAESVAKLYPSLDTDLLYSGIILHDMGKVIELSGPTATSYTLEGKLLGHITIMVNEIGDMARQLELDGEELVILQHIVLSHHSKPEWGSPKPPLIKEAEIIHMLDNLDAKMNMMDRALEKVKPGEFTERLFALDQRALYRPKTISISSQMQPERN